MNEREKLIELLVECKEESKWGNITDIADHLIAHGVTVLPCNVGGKIYYIDECTGEIEEDTVKFFTITKNGAKPILTAHNIKFWEYYELGKTAFLTKNEAEAALAIADSI